MTAFGALDDGRDGLEAVLEAAKTQIGADRRAHCDRLISAVQALRGQPNQPPARPAPADDGERAAHVTQTAGDHAIQIANARDVTITR